MGNTTNIPELWDSLLLTGSLFFLMLGLTLAVFTDLYIGKRKRGVMLLIIIFDFSLILQDVFSYLVEVDGTMPFERTLVSIFGYVIRPVILVLFAYIVVQEERCYLSWILVILNALVHLTALGSGICFRITEDNHFKRGPLGYTCHIVSGILLLNLFCLTIRKYRRYHTNIWIPMFNVLIIVGSVLLDLNYSRLYPLSYLTIAVVIANVFYYIWLHQQFEREHEEDLKAQQRIQIMMSQIQPHFLYNTLSTIQALCYVNPDQASNVTEKFGTYLRQNLDSLSLSGVIPFDKELEHTRVYAEIEMVRFPSIRLEYEIEDRDFLMPPLTIQPIVENAIRHGVRIREEGNIKVITRLEEGFHTVIIQDNGKGFEIEKLDNMEETHIGIRNVRERLEMLCGGTLEINSQPSVGTTVILRIPEQKQTNN